MVTGKSDIVDVVVEMRDDSPHRQAIAVFDGEKDKNDKEVWVWLPRSQIEVDKLEGRSVTISLPEWLAMDKGLI